MLLSNLPPNDDEEYTITPVIPVDHIIHTGESPFCFDPTCGCHEDPDLIAPVHQAYQDGELTSQEATDIVMGRIRGGRS